MSKQKLSSAHPTKTVVPEVPQVETADAPK